MECGSVTRRGITAIRVVGTTDVYTRRHIDKQLDRLDRLHDFHADKIRVLKDRIANLENLVKGKPFEEEPITEEDLH